MFFFIYPAQQTCRKGYIFSFIHSYLFINKMQHKIYKNRIGVTEGQPGKQYALMVAPKKIKHKKRESIRMTLSRLYFACVNFFYIF